MTSHDSQCENRPGGDYHGKTVGQVFGGTSTMTPIPCHCPARADGRARAQRAAAREIARAENESKRLRLIDPALGYCGW